MYHHRKKFGIAIRILYNILEFFCSGNNCDIMVDKDAVVAQLAEQLIRNEQVAGSIPVNGSIFCCLKNVVKYKYYAIEEKQ